MRQDLIEKRRLAGLAGAFACTAHVGSSVCIRRNSQSRCWRVGTICAAGIGQCILKACQNRMPVPITSKLSEIQYICTLLAKYSSSAGSDGLYPETIYACIGMLVCQHHCSSGVGESASIYQSREDGRNRNARFPCVALSDSLAPDDATQQGRTSSIHLVSFPAEPSRLP
jgi:hypothetical protein